MLLTWYINQYCHYFRDALLVAFTNCGTSIFAGFAIFCTLGFMAQDSGVEVKDVVDSGTYHICLVNFYATDFKRLVTKYVTDAQILSCLRSFFG